MRALVIYCHPLADSFGAAVRDRALAALRDGGHEVRVRDLYAEDFVPELSAAEHEHHLGPAVDKTGVADHVRDLTWCEALVLVYPTWWSGQPAMLKGWIDRVWINDVAWDLPPGANRIRPRLGNVRRLIAVTTHGSPKRVNALQGEPGKRVVTRALRVLCHRYARTRWIALYGIDTAEQARRTAFLERVGARLSRPRL